VVARELQGALLGLARQIATDVSNAG
jgi:hypothetical protein